MEKTPELFEVTSAHTESTSDLDLVDLYFHDVGEHTLLEAEEEVALAQTIERGRKASETLLTMMMSQTDAAALQREVDMGKAAHQYFVRCNLRLVINIATRYRSLPTGVSPLDLIQEGNEGLIRAVDGYDWRRGNRFATYAGMLIRGNIRDFLDQRAPLIRPAYGSMNRLREAISGANQEIDALPDEMRLLHTRNAPASFNKMLADGDIELGDLQTDGFLVEDAVIDNIYPEEVSETVSTLLTILTPNERQALELRHRLDGEDEESLKHKRSYDEISEIMNITRQGASQMVKRAEKKIRNHVEESGIALDNRGNLC